VLGRRPGAFGAGAQHDPTDDAGDGDDRERPERVRGEGDNAPADAAQCDQNRPARYMGYFFAEQSPVELIPQLAFGEEDGVVSGHVLDRPQEQAVGVADGVSLRLEGEGVPT